MKIIDQYSVSNIGETNMKIELIYYFMFGYYFVDKWFQSDYFDDKPVDRVNIIQTKSQVEAEREFSSQLKYMRKSYDIK